MDSDGINGTSRLSRRPVATLNRGMARGDGGGAVKPISISELPDELKDGRRVLLYAYEWEWIGGGGVKIVNRQKYYSFVGFWGLGGFITSSNRWIADEFGKKGNAAIGHEVFAYLPIIEAELPAPEFCPRCKSTLRYLGDKGFPYCMEHRCQLEIPEQA